MSTAPAPITHAWLFRQYVELKKPIDAIAAEFGLKYGKLCYWLHQLGIPTRAKNDRGTADERFDRKWRVDPVTGCHVWTGSTVRGGYGGFFYKGKRVTATHYAWERHRGPLPDGAWVLHSCDNPPCVNPAHLFLGTREDNVDDMVAKERHAHGESHPGAKINAALVADILRLRKAGYQHRRIGRELGLPHGLVGRVLRGETWGHITGINQKPEDGRRTKHLYAA